MNEPSVEPKSQHEEDPVKVLEDRLGPKLEEAKQRLSNLNERTKDFIRENPGASLIGAAAFGFLVGRLVSRK